MELNREDIRMIAFALRRTSEGFQERAVIYATHPLAGPVVASLAAERAQAYGELAAQFEDELTDDSGLEG